MHTYNRRSGNERGIALVLALFLMTALSVLGAGLMFLSQTETYASMNYRMMSQARYAGEAGVHKAANFLLDGAQYLPPGENPLDDITAYNRGVSPVTWGGQPVILSAVASQPSHYPIGAVQAAFDAAAKGTLTADNTAITYGAYAKLISMQMFESYGGGSRVVQTWEITGIGSQIGSRPATVEVVANIETPKVAANPYAAFATASGCGAIHFHGNVTVNSYDSSIGPPSTTTQASGGDVGTNGNLQIEGSVAVQGNLYTPRTGVGTCSEGAVTALSETGSAEVAGSAVQLPAAITWPAPTFTVTPPTTAITVNNAFIGSTAASYTAACSSLGTVLAGGVQVPLTYGVNCFVTTAAGNTTISIDGNGSEVTLPSIHVGTNYTLDIVGNGVPAQTVNINSLSGENNSNFQVTTTAANQSVVLKVSGKNPDATEMAVPVDMSVMGWKQNAPGGANYDASAVQLVYGGSGTIMMTGGNVQSAATIYAPNAAFQLQGTQDLFGSILARTIENQGNASIHYDRRLGRDFWVPGHPMASTFTWKRY